MKCVRKASTSAVEPRPWRVAAGTARTRDGDRSDQHSFSISAFI